ncbi:MAG: aldo/keto reductase [Nannocystaceae bacterium]|nr:aldo/keto reductase [Nannocystaceae bacterium]
MHTLSLHDGTPFPAFGLGTWLSEPEHVYRAVREALKLGYRHIDAAWIYFNEEEVGRGIREAIAAGDVTREELWVTTKLWNDMHAPGDVQAGLDASLKQLGLDYIDLYLVHWPVAHSKGVVRPKTGSEFLAPPASSLEATWESMAKLPATDKTRQVGVSNFSVRKLDLISEATGLAPAVNQVELHPYNAQPAFLAEMKKRGVAVTAYSPLGSSGRPDSMRRADETRLLDDPTVGAIAQTHGCGPAQILIAWALSRGTAVIPKSTNPERIAQNLAATEVTLSEEQVRKIDALNRDERYVTGEFWCPEGSPHTLESLWG